jgi:hypothetical protein
MAIGTVLEGGYRVTDILYEGMFVVGRAVDAGGTGVQVTIANEAPPQAAIAAIALPGVEQIPALIAIVSAATPYGREVALLEAEPAGRRVAMVTQPLPIADVFAIGRELVALVRRVHATGAVLGSLRPQTTWIDGGHLVATTPRPERFGLAGQGKGCAGQLTPFSADAFLPAELARGEAPSVASDVAQLAMMMYRLATGRSPFHGPGGLMDEMMRTIRGEVAPWQLVAGDPRGAALERVVGAQLLPGPRSLVDLAALVEA